jgi:hypothetical protein
MVADPGHTDTTFSGRLGTSELAARRSTRTTQAPHAMSKAGIDGAPPRFVTHE